VDVIVGFPGETEEHFLDTYRFLEQLPIGYLHVFTYSERANTAASDYSGAVPLAERKARNHRLRLLSAMKQRAFSQLHVGSVRRVLWESENRDGRMLGYTENYLRMHRPFDPNRVHTVEHVTVGAISADGTLEALPLSPTA
jgi:threonylcarbamoyladenosine tRNA methylthiotransferase MtaB